METIGKTVSEIPNLKSMMEQLNKAKGKEVLDQHSGDQPKQTKGNEDPPYQENLSDGRGCERGQI